MYVRYRKRERAGDRVCVWQARIFPGRCAPIAIIWFDTALIFNAISATVVKKREK
jgi:hypothetical protein